MPRLSAGRVQSVATRLVVARERERIAFRAARYWDLQAEFARRRRSAAGRDHVPGHPGRGRWPPGRAGPGLRPAGRAAQQRRLVPVRPGRRCHRAARRAAPHVGPGAGRLRERNDFSVKSVERKPYRRSPYAPFRTTTLQQEASRKLSFSAKYTMGVAQRLYENGHITYMRTDSTTLSQTAIDAARRQARELYGAEYVPYLRGGRDRSARRRGARGRRRQWALRAERALAYGQAIEPYGLAGTRSREIPWTMLHATLSAALPTRAGHRREHLLSEGPEPFLRTAACAPPPDILHSTPRSPTGCNRVPGASASSCAPTGSPLAAASARWHQFRSRSPAALHPRATSPTPASSSPSAASDDERHLLNVGFVAPSRAPASASRRRPRCGSDLREMLA